MTTEIDLDTLLKHALEQRQPLLEKWHEEGSDCYRLLHGVAEGWPGVTIDRYGPQLMIQSFYQPLQADQLTQIQTIIDQRLDLSLAAFYMDRSGKGAQTVALAGAEEAPNEALCRELGVLYRTRARHRGQDPLLFLDLRAGRRWMLAKAKGHSVLNLFAYTCGMGICASIAGASEVVNIDFAQSTLAVGRENATMNSIENGSFFVQSDFFPAVRQLAGLPVKFRRRRGSRPPKYPRFEARQFSLVVLDPPRWAKSPYGTVDLIRDYASVFKPALLATAPGGRLLCTNNVAQVDREDWLDQLKRSAIKAGRPVKVVELIEPEADFPTFDGQPPLKMVVLKV